MVLSFDPTLGIAFEGCACRAAFHVGALEWLSEHGFRAAAVAGASSGSLVAAAVAMNGGDGLRGAWMELVGGPVCDWRRLMRARWPFRMTEIVSAAAKRHFGGATMGDTAVPLGIAVTEWRNWRFRRRLITSRDRLRIAAVVQASCFFPGPYWQMVPLDGRPTFDGAWLGRVPVDDVEALGARKVIACSSDLEGRLLKGAIRPTEVASPKADYRVLYPTEPLALGSFDFDRTRFLEAFAIGRASAAVFVQRHGTWLIDQSAAASAGAFSRRGRLKED